MPATRYYVFNIADLAWPQTPTFSATVLTPHYRALGSGINGQTLIATAILPDQSRPQKLRFIDADLTWPQTPTFSATALTPHYRALGSGINGQIRRTSIIIVIPAADITSSVIPTGESWSTFVVAGPITATAMPSGESWFTPTVSHVGVPQTVTLTTAITSGEAWPTPDVAGPITVSPIPSGEAWPAPTIGLSQTVSPTVIASGETWYPPRVANVQTIRPSVIPSAENWFAPLVTGGPQYISALTIRSGERWFTPSVTGGAAGFFIYISGVNRTAYFSWVEGTCTIDSQTIGRWQATFDLYDSTGSYTPQLGQTVLMLDYGRRAFAGCISKIQIARAMSTVMNVTYHVTAVDKSGICDHRVVTTGKTYTAGSDVAATIIDIASTSLQGEGISTALIPSDGSLGTLPSDIPVNFQTVTALFDTVANLTGTVWWIDSDAMLHFSPLTSLPAAPFSITETSRNWRNLVVTSDLNAYYNKLYAVSNRNIVPGGNGGSGGTGSQGFTETFTLTIGQPGVDPVSDVNGRPVGVLMSTGIGSVISMTVNGHVQTAYDFVNNYHAQTRTGLTDYLWVYAAGNNELSWTFEPPADAVIVVQYVPYAATNTSIAQYGSALRPTDIHGDPLGTCGSGLYEGVIQVQDIDNQDDLNAIAAAALTRIGGLPIVADYETDYPGLVPGQLQNANIPNAGLVNVDLLVTRVSGQFIPPDGPGNSTGFTWNIQARSNLDPGNWEKWYERLVRRTANALPILQVEEATFVLGPGSSISSGVALTNPYIVGRTGLAIELLLAAALPPVDETLVLTVTRNGVPIATVQMPATTASNALITVAIPKANQLYLYKGDVLNVDSSYLVTGTAPVGAQALTLKIRWTM